MLNKKLLSTVLIVVMLAAAGSAFAGAKLKINDTSSINLGFRLQAQMNTMDQDLDGDNAYDTFMGFKVRRARFRLKGVINEHASMFLQTDATGDRTMKMIDAFATFKHDNWTQVVVGRHMVPANRQNLTSSGALMAIDRPGMAYKSLSWGVNAKKGFTNGGSYAGGAPGALAGNPEAVRGAGLTFFGTGDVGDEGHIKYYAGMYNGRQAGTDDKNEYAFRVQYNLWDAEPGYFNSSTYLGKKKTLGIGFSYDLQDQVGTNSDVAKPLADYAYMSADMFLELPDGNGNALTAEFGYMNLDFDDAVDYLASQGNGFYGQAGYYFAQGWQPWFEFESWSSDAANDDGNYTAFRGGLTYYIDGQHANIKAGYENFSTDNPMIGTEDSMNTFTLGFYTTY